MERFNDVKKASILGILVNIFLCVIKGIIGFTTKSQAMIADCFNSAGDIFSSFMTYIGNKIASKPSDEDHNLGHGKAEYIFSMWISMAMIFISVNLFKDSVITLFSKNEYSFSIWLIVVCIITIIAKFSLFLYTYNISKRHNNLLIKANSKDHINDCFVTMFTLVSCILALNNIYFLDGIVGIGISIWIMITALKIFIESYNVLMDKAISEEEKNKVFDIIKRYDEVKKVIHFNSTPVRI